MFNPGRTIVGRGTHPSAILTLIAESRVVSERNSNILILTNLFDK